LLHSAHLWVPPIAVGVTSSLGYPLKVESSTTYRVIKSASFNMLPKVHKQFVNVPTGRPVSSTCNTLNKNISALLDFILKPILNITPNLIIDTSHLLILLRELKLDSKSKYVIVTYDI